MASTVVGVFDDYTEAQRASEKLQSLGIGLDDVRVNSSESSTGSSSYSEPQRENEGGIRGWFASLFGADDDEETTGHYSEAVRRGSSVVTVNLQDDSRTDEVVEVLEECGAIDVDERVAQWKSSGYTGYDASAKPYTSEDIQRERGQMTQGGEKLQVVQEDLKVGKREVRRGGVRVHRRVTERPVEEQVTLREERARIERTPVDRPATSAELSGMRDQDIEITETAEEAVVSKSARVVEEVSVGKETKERKQTVRDTVRRADVEVEQLGGRLDDGAPSQTSPMAPHLRNESMQGNGTPISATSGRARYNGPERRKQPLSPWAGTERRMSH